MQVIRWHSEKLPREQDLRTLMQQEGLQPYSWSNDPDYAYSVHTHDYEKVLYCVQGAIRFTLPEQRDAAGAATYVDLAPGDCMILPAHTAHSALVGAQGVTCLEAPRR
ncbi:MAG TPA: AraC family ligand binding domain-containing protein [Dictyobacter sp.]|jgi:mannose-6-phosphate isomerase-like protein (cupin superfamily)|nr:AraC family ligand binding domain-containing protein [Dictyobacter sp.]